ncbi:MAG: hypothetical protein ABIY70_04475 [Capsulimonas sp.]|uniref:hypothetical protein n=1 Tax=Capsulimonas sp. TaxID=2494211 RepID=UPI00326615A5
MDTSPLSNKRRSPKRSVIIVMTAVVIGAFAAVGVYLWSLERDPRSFAECP